MTKISSTSKTILGIIEDIKINSIMPSLIPVRHNLAGLEVLANSIKQNGLLQPILVRTNEDIFEIVAGNRRYYACKTLGWRKVLCHIIELNDKESFEISLIENIQRRTLNAVEESHAFKKYVIDFGWGGVSDLALKLGKSVGYVTKRIKLLDLPADVIHSINNSSLNTSIAEELFCIKSKFKQSEIAGLISARNLSFRKARQVIKEIGNDFSSPSTNQFFEIPKSDPSEISQRSFDKSITALRMVTKKLSSIIEDNQDNWIIYEVLMQHRNMLNSQIDLLIKQKKKRKAQYHKLSNIPAY
jgi:ParB family transcriptional regulator, chromosome partitioning protein